MSYLESKNFRRIGGIAIGAVLGFMWYHFVGCRTGACPISSRPLVSTFYGMVMGGVVTF
jgi:hypothetical protein